MNLQSSLSRRLRRLILFGLLLTAAFTVSMSGTGAEQWTNLAPSNPPPARFGQTMVSDSANDRAIMFGGAANCVPLKDVWLLTGASGRTGPAAWSQLAPTGTGPDARYAANAVYDAASNRMIVFGGAAGGYCSGAPPLRNDVWVLTNANGLGGAPAWIQVSPPGSRPAARGASTSVYDPSSNRLIVFGGNRAIGFCGSESNDTWILTSANGLGTPSWINVSPIGGPPIARFQHSSVYDASANEMIVLGGQNSCGGTLYADAWALVNANGVADAPAWVSLGSAPSVHASHTAVLDAAQHRMLMFGGSVPGLTNGVHAMSNTNTTTGQTWTSLTPSGTPPSPRYSHAAVFDNVRQSMIVFGGADGFGVMSNDTWVLSLGPAATTLTMPAASGTFGGTTILRATLSSASGPVGGVPVAFSLFGAPVGSATTAGNGVATLNNVSIAGQPAAAYSGVVGASIVATANYLASSATADLTVDKAPVAISVTGGGTFLYDGSAHSASGSATGVIGESLGPASMTYTDRNSLSTSSAAPIDAGSYDVSASFGGDTNYLAGANNSARITINQLSTGTSLTVLTAPWQTKSSMPTARNGVAAAAIDGLIYVAGGYNGSHLLTVEAYDPVSNTWTGKANRPSTQTQPAIGVINGKLYTAGGTNCCIEISTLYEYTPASDSWAPKAPMPTTRQDATGGVVNNRLYVAGGLNSAGSGAHGTFSTLEEYDPSAGPAGTWTTKASMPTARRGAGGASAGGQFYVVGGQNASGTALNTVEAYDPSTNTWTTKTPMPTARYAVEIAQVGGLLYAIGGGVGTNYLTTVEAYDPTTNTWSTYAPLLTARVYHNTVVVNGTIYAIGGSSASVIGATEAYTPPSPPTSSTFGQTVTLTATVNTVAPGSGTAGGAVTFRNGSSVVGTATLNSSGVATLTTSTLAAGSYTFSADYGGNTNFAGSTGGPRDHTVADTTPPTTTAAPSPAANAAGWNKTSVTVALNAADDAGGSGVQSIVYSLNGAQSGSFTTAGNVAFVSIVNDGTTTINYHAVDNNGNVEGDHPLMVKVDRTPPFLSFPFNIFTQASSSAGAVVAFSASGSDGLSGLAGPAIISPLAAGAIFPIGTTHETISATDVAGNTAIGHFDVVVNPARPIVNVIGGTFTADGNPHPATATATDQASNPVAGTFSIAYAPGGSAPAAAGRYSATASFTSSDPAFTSVFPWTTMAADPHAKAAPAIAEINGKLYVHGFDQNGSGQSSFVPRLSIYDPASNTWTIGASPSLIRAFANTVAINGKLYVVGGCVMSDCRIGVADARALEIYNPVTNSWSSGASMPTGRLGAAAGAIGGKLYVTGGTTECPPCGTTNTTEIYDPVANTWTSGAPIPATRELAAGAVVNGLLYVIGGYERASVNANVGTVSVYDPVVNSWSTRSSMPIVRRGAAVGVINGNIYVVGGLASGPLAVSESYNPASDTWTEQLPMSTARQYTAGGVVNSTLYVIDGTNSAQLATNEAFDSSLTALITIDPGDTTPPTTNANFQSPNANGWNRSDVVLNVNANDSGGAASPSGVRSITYTLTGAQTGGGTFNTTSTSFTIFNEGTTTVTYHATDNAGNVEADHTLLVRLDKTAPSVANLPSLTVDATSTAGAVVTFDPAPSDSLSGIDTVTVTQGFASGSTFPHGTTSETVRVTDLAGNFASRFFSVTVNKTLLSIAVTPSTASVNIGQDRQFQATGHFTNGSDQTLSTSGGGGGQSGGSLWSVNFASGIGLNPATCGVSSQGNFFNSEVIAVNPSTGTIIPSIWEPGNPLVQVVGGQITPSQISFSLMCTASSAPGSFSATWNGQAYVGTFTGAGQSAAVTIASQTSGGGGGSIVPGSATWYMLFPSGFNANACGNVSAGFSGQGISPDSTGAVSTSWGQGNPIVQVSGTVTAQQVALTFGCIPANGAVGSLSATWTGTRYVGAATFSGSTSPVSILGWSTKAPLPTARFAFGAATVNGIVYAMGGGNPAQPQAVDAYNPATNAWSTVSQMLTPREGAGVVALNGKIYVVGGHVAGGVASGVFEVYDPATNSWNTQPSMPTPRAHHALVAAGGKLYAIGGDTGSNNSNTTAVVESYDPATNQWTARAPMLTSRNFVVAGSLNNEAMIVAVSGSSTEVYDVAANTWTLGPAPLSFVGLPGAAVVNNALFVFGASSGQSTQMFRPAGNSQPAGWAVMASMPTARGELAVAAVGDVVYVIGGQANSLAIATVEGFSTPPPGGFSVTSGSGGSSGGGSGGSGSSSLPTVSWQSTDPSIAGINSSGFATGSASGQTTIVATAAGVSCATTDTCATLTVINPPHITFTLAPGSATFGSVQVTVVDPSTGQAVDGPFEVPIAEPQSVDDGQFFRLVFTAPIGYTVTPIQVDLNVHAGDDITVPLLFALIDTTAPVLTAPGDQTAEATSSAGAAVMFAAATATDSGSGIDSVSCDRSPGDTFSLGSTTVHCSATDRAGNSASATFHVTVVDTTPPNVTAPANVIVSTDAGQARALVAEAAVSAVASDNSGTVTVARAGVPAANNFPMGTTTVTYTATDTSGNTATATQTVTVHDTELPRLSAPANVVVGTGPGSTQTGAVVNDAMLGSAVASDNSGPVTVARAGVPAGNFFPIGTARVTYTATDSSGNSVSAVQQVTVTDTTPPTLTLPANVTKEAASSTGAMVTFEASAADNIDGPIPVTCAPASGLAFALGTTTVACTAIDAHGNPASGAFSVTVVDTTKPMLALPANISVDATSPAGAVVTYSVSATDLASHLVVICARPSGSTFPIGTSTVMCTATDNVGNTSSGNFQVLVQAAAAQVGNLIGTVQGFNLAQGIENSLDTKLQSILSALSAAISGNVGSVCGQLGGFINETRAQSGKKLTVTQANELIARAQQIEAVIGCQ